MNLLKSDEGSFSVLQKKKVFKSLSRKLVELDDSSGERRIESVASLTTLTSFHILSVCFKHVDGES